jgi:hypothetical protein
MRAQLAEAGRVLRDHFNRMMALGESLRSVSTLAPLDPTYAAKALAALLAAARAGEPGPFLFVVTCPPQGPVDDPDPAHLPPPVRALFR